jgi:hypothetical protein
VKRCAPTGGCRPECDLCTSGAECCSGTCGVDAMGVSRCQPSSCGAIGEICDKDPDCCPGSRCAPEPEHAGPKRCQPPAGAPCVGENACAISTECCAGRCVPSESGRLCAPACLPVGAACSARADCCGPTVDCLAVGGARTCAPLVR